MSFAFRQEGKDDGKLRYHDKMRVCLKRIVLHIYCEFAFSVVGSHTYALVIGSLASADSVPCGYDFLVL